MISKMDIPTRLYVIAALVVATTAQNSYQPPGVSPCPHIFTYEQKGTEQGKWYGLINLTTDITLHSLWLNVVLDSKADILGNWVGEVTTKDNIDFKIENIGMKITPGPPTQVRFFVQYNVKDKVPIVKYIRLNGKEICNLGSSQRQKAEITLVRNELNKKSSNSGKDKSVNSWQRSIETNTTNKSNKNLRNTVLADITTKTDSMFNNIKSDGNLSTRYDTNIEKFDTNVQSDTKTWLDTNIREIVAQASPVSDLNSATILYDGHSSLRNYKEKDTHTSQGINGATGNRDTKQETAFVQNDRDDYMYVRPINQANVLNASYEYTTMRKFNDDFKLITTTSKKPPSADSYISSENEDQIIKILNQYTTTRRSYSDLGLTTSTNSPDLNFEFANDKKDDEVQNYDDYVGGIPTIFIPSNLEKVSYDQKRVQCGTVIYNKSRSSAYEDSLEGQFPWQIALYQNQRSGENKYICGGTLATHRHIITAAHCVTRRNSLRLVNKNTLTIYLGKNNLRTSVDGVQIKFVEKITIHPGYNATTFNKDLAILELKEPVSYTDHVRPICLWPESLVNLRSVIGKFGSLVGWGFEVSGATKQELSLVQMPVVEHDTCVNSYSAFFARIISEYTYCATYAEGTSVCNGDSGGGMVFKNGDTWYIRGVASLAITRENQYRCDPNHYVIFTDIAKFLPWIKNNIYDY